MNEALMKVRLRACYSNINVLNALRDATISEALSQPISSPHIVVFPICEMLSLSLNFPSRGQFRTVT